MRTVGSIGERGLIKMMAKGAVMGRLDDDVAVVKNGRDYLLYTIDTLVEDNHFSRTWMSPRQVGEKAVEVNVSDIYASGGRPQHLLVALALPKGTPVSWVQELYQGMRVACKRHGCDIIGGDTTKADKVIITITATGKATKKQLCLRSSAKPGDFIFITGPLGGSAAALDALRSKLKGHKKAKDSYLRPRARGKAIKSIREHINAMVDVSDGLSSEVHHLCRESGVGCLLFLDNIPIDDATREVAARLGKDPLEYALSGGEDFQLLYTLPEKHLKRARGYLIGEITKDRGVRAVRFGKERTLKDRGFNQLR